MPNQSDPNSGKPVSQPAIPPITSGQSDLPPLPPDFKSNTPSNSVVPPINQSTSQPANPVTGSSAPPGLSSVISSKPKKKFGGGKVIATILGIFLLVGGTTTGVYLTQQKQNIFSFAWESKADRQRSNDKQGTNYKLDGNDKADSTKEPPDKPDKTTAQCLSVKAYSSTWAPLTIAPPGTVVNFCVAGTASAGSFDQAEFKIGSTAKTSVTTLSPRPGATNEFCQTYTILSTDTTFSVKARIHHTTLGWEGEAI